MSHTCVCAVFDGGSTTDIHTCTVLGNTLTEGGGGGGGGFGPSGRDIIHSNKKRRRSKHRQKKIQGA
jgi:hypothetical protein